MNAVDTTGIYDLKKGLKDGIPIGLGYFSVSFSFGILAVSGGLTCGQAVLISLFNLTSAGQFAGITVMFSMGTYLEMMITQFVINLRYALMSLSLSQKAEDDFRGIWRVLLSFGITDEIYGVASNHKLTKNYFLGLMIAPYIGWGLGTACGGVLGNVLPEILSNALGISLYGMFIAIVVPKAKKEKSVLVVVLLTALFSILIYYVPTFAGISPGFSIILCGVLASGIGAFLFPLKDKEEETI